MNRPKVFFESKVFCILFLNIILLSCGADKQTNKSMQFQDLGITDTFLIKVKARVLLTTRFIDLNDFKKRVSLSYYNDTIGFVNTKKVVTSVRISYFDNGQLIYKCMRSGVDQKKLIETSEAGVFVKANLAFFYPSLIRQRSELKHINILARRKMDIFGVNDVAFYDLAQLSLSKINTPDLAYLSSSDSSEKGYINTFNHVTAQAIITSFFSEEMADLISDLHERKSMPELTTGIFSKAQLLDSINNPLDNYVDIVNNEIGQKIGKLLKEKYQISYKTPVTPKILADYLNDIQNYYSWALGIGFNPCTEGDYIVEKFAKKINWALSKV